MPIAWLVNSWVVLFGLIPLLLVLFPNGHLLSARWRPVVWLTPPTMILGFFTVGLDLGPMTTQVPLLEAAFGPETGGWLVQAGRNLQGCAMLAAFVARASCLGLRLYRARGDERAQLKWFGYASMVLACTFVVLHLIFASPLREALDSEDSVRPQFARLPRAPGAPQAAALVRVREPSSWHAIMTRSLQQDAEPRSEDPISAHEAGIRQAKEESMSLDDNKAPLSGHAGLGTG